MSTSLNAELSGTILTLSSNFPHLSVMMIAIDTLTRVNFSIFRSDFGEPILIMVDTNLVLCLFGKNSVHGSCALVQRQPFDQRRRIINKQLAITIVRQIPFNAFLFLQMLLLFHSLLLSFTRRNGNAMKRKPCRRRRNEIMCSLACTCKIAEEEETSRLAACVRLSTSTEKEIHFISRNYHSIHHSIRWLGFGRLQLQVEMVNSVNTLTQNRQRRQSNVESNVWYCGTNKYKLRVV